MCYHIGRHRRTGGDATSLSRGCDIPYRRARGRRDFTVATGARCAVVQREFETRDEAIEWMYQHQLGRRNLTDDQRSVVAYQLQQQRSKIARQKRSEAANEKRWADTAPSLSDAASEKDSKQSAAIPVDTRAAVAKEFKVSERKLKQVRTVATQAPEVLRDVQQGRTTLAEAVREIKRATVVEQLTSVAAVEAKATRAVATRR
jgi:hypothetical protein